MQKILITGANGLVGQSLLRLLIEKNYPVIAVGRGASRIELEAGRLIYYEADLTDPFQLQQIIAHEQPDCIVHGAAKTQVDDCERSQAEAHVQNVEATARLLLDAEAYAGHIILLSTDFVFDGIEGNYAEEADPAPVNWYGHTKMEAEAIIQTAAIPWSIIRTCLVYGENAGQGRNNIFSWVRENCRAGKSIKVVDDQWRTPTWVQDLVNGIELVIASKATGIWHLAGADMLSPYQMAMAMAEYFNWNSALIERVTADSFQQAGQRPMRTGLNINKAQSLLGYSPGSFSDNLRYLKG